MAGTAKPEAWNARSLRFTSTTGALLGIGVLPRHASSYHCLDLRRHGQRILVLPDAEHVVALELEDLIRLLISRAVPLDLAAPPLCVGLWRYAMLGAPMPKTTVHEDCDPSAREKDVHPAPPHTGNGGVDVEPKPAPMKLGAELELWRAIAATDATHALADFYGRRGRATLHAPVLPVCEPQRALRLVIEG